MSEVSAGIPAFVSNCFRVCVLMNTEYFVDEDRPGLAECSGTEPDGSE